MRNILKNISVSAFINTLFALVLSLLFGALFLFIYLDKNMQKEEDLTRDKLISDYFLSTAQLNQTKEEKNKFYKNFHIKPISLNQSRELILSKGEVVFGGDSVYGKLQIFTVGKHRYIYIQRYGYKLMLKDNQPKSMRILITVIIALLIAVLFIFLYVAIIRKLTPLKKLTQQIEEFANGNMNIKITQKSNDEIGKIAQSFDNAIHHIRTLLESKNLFMRNMMHELKTPITRGRIAIEMVEDGMSKEILIRSFERMNELIAELAYVERLTTQDFKPSMRESNLHDIINDSIELLLIDREKLDIQVDNSSLTTDKKLLSLAIKNLLDNALKYGEKEKITIMADRNAIQVISFGKSLENPLSYYLEPFTQEEKRNSGFGLGLYIVNNITDRLGYELNYFHKSGKNIFELNFKYKD